MDIAHTSDLSKNLRFQYGSFSYSSLLDYFSDFYRPKSWRHQFRHRLLLELPAGFRPLGLLLQYRRLRFLCRGTVAVVARFTLDIGLRYEYEKLPSPFSSLINSAVPQTGSFPSDKNNFGPRIGFAWDIFGTGKTFSTRWLRNLLRSHHQFRDLQCPRQYGNANGQLSFTISPTIKVGTSNCP